MSTQPFKDMEGKIRLDLVAPEIEWAIGEVSNFGIEKLKAYGIENPERNWEKGLPIEKAHIGAVLRHINKWRRGIDEDEESGLSHLKHALWHLGAAVTQIMRERFDLDDRISKKIPGTKISYEQTYAKSSSLTALNSEVDYYKPTLLTKENTVVTCSVSTCSICKSRRKSR